MRTNRFLMVVLGGTAALAVLLGLVWNEYEYFSRLDSLAWAERHTVHVSTDRVADRHDGKLVYVKGDIEAPNRRVDPTFDISDERMKMIRRVEMYQWQEKQIDRSDEPATYRYYRDWSEEPFTIEQANRPEKLRAAVREADSRMNPKKPYPNESFLASDATIGAYEVSEPVLRVPGTTPKLLDKKHLDRLPDKFEGRARLTETSDEARQGTHAICIHAPKNSGRCGDEVGDVRIRWETWAGNDVGVVAGLEEGVLVPFEHEKLDDPLALVERNATDDSYLYDRAEGDARTWLWVWRAIGALVLPFFLFFVLQGLHDEEIALPWIGELTQGKVFLYAIAGTVALVALVAGQAWLVFGLLSLGI